MRNISASLLLLLVLVSCKNTQEQGPQVTESKASSQTEYVSFGQEIQTTDVIDGAAMMALYTGMSQGDTIQTTFRASVNSVCKMKGCWMRLAVEDKEAFVKFKDYAFFVPKYLSEVEVIVAGKAYVSETSVDDLKHFAQDAGKSQEEIDAITQPELSLDFMADGVLVPASAIVEENTSEETTSQETAQQDQSAE